MGIDVLMGFMIFIFGLVLGSFYNVVGYRVPNNMSIVFPASHCPNCNHKLRFYELIPVLSFVFLGGKCKKCKKRISFFYPFFELLTGICFLLSYLVFGISIEFFISITFLSTLIIISISDLKYYIIPDEVLIVGTILLLIEMIINCIINDVSFFNGLFMPILSGAGSFAILFLIKILGDAFFKKESLGGGDIKLLFVIGLVIGFDMSLVSIFLASFIALPVSVVQLVKKNDNVVSFGPYLSLAAAIILLTNLNFDKLLLFFTS